MGTAPFDGALYSVGGSVEAVENFPLNGSPAQQKAALVGFVDLLDGRLQGLADQYNRGMGKTDDPLNLLQPKARAAYEKLSGRAPPTDATGYQTGKPTGSNAAAASQDAEAGTSTASPATPTKTAPDPMAAARDAINRGAPRDAVIKRLRENGIDPGGL